MESEARKEMDLSWQSPKIGVEIEFLIAHKIGGRHVGFHVRDLLHSSHHKTRDGVPATRQRLLQVLVGVAAALR